MSDIITDTDFEDDDDKGEKSLLLFEIEGVPRKKSFLKKYRSYIAVYFDHLYLELDGDEDYTALDDIFDIYIQEPIIEDVPSRTTVIFHYDEAEQFSYELEDATFPGLSEKMELLIKNEWACIPQKHQHSDTVAWFNACCAPLHIAAGNNPALYGGNCKEPETTVDIRKVLYDSWGFNSKEELLAMLAKLLEGRAMKQYMEDLENIDDLDEDKQALSEEIQKTCGKKGIWAWDLQRLILLSSYGYICDYLSAADSLDWCLKAGLKLQSIYSSWDDFMTSYLLGYAYWSGDDFDDEYSDASERAQIYEYYKNKANGPFAISWNYPLKRE